MTSFVLYLGRTARNAFRRGLAFGLRLLPVSSEVLGPPRGVIRSFSAWCRERESRLPYLERGWDQWMWPVRDAEVVESPLPRTIDESLHPVYRGAQWYRYPELFVAFLRNARVAGDEGFVISPDDRVFEEFHLGTPSNPGDWPIFYSPRLPPVRKVNDGLALIASPANMKPNYFHWMADVLPRLAILEAAGMKYFRLMVPSILMPWQKDILLRLGYGPDRWVPYDGGHWKVEALLVPSLPGYSGMVRPWAVRWLREKLSLPSGRKPTRRIYIRRSRAGFRRVANEDEVLEILDRAGFEPVELEGLSLAEQIDLFSEVSAAVSIHGAGLTNLLFAQPGATVLEFMSPLPQYANACYYSLCSAAGHQYGYLMGEHRRQTSAAPPAGRWRIDLWIDPEKLQQMLDVSFHKEKQPKRRVKSLTRKK